MSSPTRALKTVVSITIPGSPLRLHSHDSYTPPFRAKKLPGFAKEDNNTRQTLRMLVKRQAECRYQESKMMFWRQIACLTRTDVVAAHELLVMCVEGCRNSDDTNMLGCIKKELSAEMCGMFDLQYCVLAAFFHAVQANQRLRVPLPLPLLHPTVLGPLSDVVSQAAKFTADHHDNHLRVHALGLVSWLASQQVAASVSCGATLPVAVSERLVSGLKS